MKLKHTIVAGLVLTGMSLFAELPELNKSKNFFDTNPGLCFRGVDAHKSILDRNAKTSFSGKEWDEAEVSGGGLFINFGIHLPSSTFMDIYGSGLIDFGLGYDFEFGSFFRFAKIQDGKMGVGLRATWLSGSYSKAYEELFEQNYHNVQLSLVRVGPEFSFAIDDKMGVDAFYTIGASFSDVWTAIDDPTEDKDIGVNWGYWGITHELGAAFHYKVYSVGLGYRFGKVKNFSYIYDGEQKDKDARDDEKRSINNFRVTIGFRF